MAVYFGDAGDNVIFGMDENDVVHGLGGNDTLGGGVGDDILNGGDGLDVLNGEAGNDTLNGDAGDDFMRGSAGADTLNGGAGTDWALYDASPTVGGITVTIGGGAGSGGDAQGDVIGADVENIEATDYDDVLTGSASANHFRANDGNDVLAGMGGNDHLEGGLGDDLLEGGAGADVLSGGDGIDTVSYAASTAAVTIDLGTSSASGGDAAGDDFFGSDIEDIQGSAGFGDTLTGDAGANRLIGLGGADTLNGQGGADVLVGGDGNDVLRGGAGGDTLIGDAGIDLVSYYYSAAGVTVSLATGSGAGGEAQLDILSAIENVNGSFANDTLIGDAGANALNGWVGKDVLTGGAGADRFVFTAANHSVVGANADRITDFSHAQGDRIDLAALDANSGVAGDQAFSFIGTGAFTGVAGQLHYAASGGQTVISGDINGDSAADFNIVLTGTPALVAGDFVL